MTPTSGVRVDEFMKLPKFHRQWKKNWVSFFRSRNRTPTKYKLDISNDYSTPGILASWNNFVKTIIRFWFLFWPVWSCGNFSSIFISLTGRLRPVSADSIWMPHYGEKYLPIFPRVWGRDSMKCGNHSENCEKRGKSSEFPFFSRETRLFEREWKITLFLPLSVVEDSSEYKYIARIPTYSLGILRVFARVKRITAKQIGIISIADVPQRLC